MEEMARFIKIKVVHAVSMFLVWYQSVRNFNETHIKLIVKHAASHNAVQCHDKPSGRQCSLAQA